MWIAAELCYLVFVFIFCIIITIEMFRHDLYRKAVLESSRETLLGVPFIVNLQCVGGSEIFY